MSQRLFDLCSLRIQYTYARISHRHNVSSRKKKFRSFWSLKMYPMRENFSASSCHSHEGIHTSMYLKFHANIFCLHELSELAIIFACVRVFRMRASHGKGWTIYSHIHHSSCWCYLNFMVITIKPDWVSGVCVRVCMWMISYEREYLLTSYALWIRYIQNKNKKSSYSQASPQRIKNTTITATLFWYLSLSVCIPAKAHFNILQWTMI